MRMKQVPLVAVLLVLLGLAACTRSATPSSVEATLPFPVPETDEAMQDILQGGFATQTAIARGEGAQPAATATETVIEVPTATEVPAPTATLAPTQAVSGSCSSPYTVQAGEWVYSIGRKCGVDPQAIINANNLQPPYLLFPGDKLTLPSGSESSAPPSGGASCTSPYTVSLGEWVYSIARKCGVSPEAIISANNLAFPYTIFPGQQLVIP